MSFAQDIQGAVDVAEYPGDDGFANSGRAGEHHVPAILACAKQRNRLPVCQETIKSLVKALLDKEAVIEIVAAVLAFEA